MKRTTINSIFIILLTVSFVPANLTAQEGNNEIKQDVYLDRDGVMRWGHNDVEVKGFGVNYSAPFAHAYRTAQRLDVDLKEAIDRDVYHFSRLGFDLYRIHVWDTEISDAEGNLLENENLEMFDYLLKQLKDRGINFVITPIAYWGSGWPEPDPETPGFSHKYGKEGSLTHPDAIKAQENYLAQFLNHVNPHTGVAYKDEPNIIAFEVSNEPHHRGTSAEVKEFIDRLVGSMRSTGTKKPIFYNVTHSVHLAETYFDAEIDGGTFQWYPTGLGFGKELQGNLLPNVNDYNIPFDDVIRRNNAGKLVYEFDAADVMKSYIYPAMARSFREAGIQIGTHFAYDPTYMAYANTEYDTHYMNLAYTPQKALALMITGEVFHQVPMYAELGDYPMNKNFGDFAISYEEDLAEYNSDEKFLYTNTTSSTPKSIKKLRQIAGYGNSPVVEYAGKGAYFLDKLQDGVWRLEVMPDAVLVDNPFGDNSAGKTIAVLKHNTWNMKVNLPDLKKGFTIQPLNEGNDYIVSPAEGSFSIRPGSYLLKRTGVRTTLGPDDEWENKRLGVFGGPEGTVDKTYLVHEPRPEITENSEMDITAEVVSNEEIEKVEVWLQNGNTYESLQLQNSEGYTWTAVVLENLLNNGFLRYTIIVTTPNTTFTYPAGVEGDPSEWDFHAEGIYTTRIVTENRSVYLFEALTDTEDVVREWRKTLNTVPGVVPGEAEYQVRLEELFTEDVENPNAEPVYDYSFRYYFRDKIAGRRNLLSENRKLVLKGRALDKAEQKLQVAFVMKSGASFGTVIELDQEMKEYAISFADLEPVQTVTLPRPYPSFLPYYFEHNLNESFDIEDAESLQFSIGPGLSEQELREEQGVGIVSVRLE